MTYTPTAFNEGIAPGISATELNKLGTGVQSAATTADAALSTALDAEVGLLSATSAYVGTSYRVRTYDGPPITSLTPVADAVLTVSVPDVSGKVFLAKALVLYIADTILGGQLGLAVYNGQPTRDPISEGGIGAYGYAETPTGPYAQPTLLAWDNIGADLAPLDGDDDTVKAATLTALIVNGQATGDVVVSVVAARPEGINATDLRILAGSCLAVEELT